MVYKRRRSKAQKDDVLVKKTRKNHVVLESHQDDDVIDVVSVDENPCTQSKLKPPPEQLRLYDCMQTMKHAKIQVNQRYFYEQALRSYLLAELDVRIDEFEKVALNERGVKERAGEFYPMPTDDCFACQILNQKNGGNEIGPVLKKTRDRNKLTYPEIDCSSCLNVTIPVHNPLFKSYVARYPDMRLSGQNIDKLRKMLAPQKRTFQKDPVAVHTCQRRYGDFLNSTTQQRVSHSTLTIRSLFFYQSIPSKLSFQGSSKLIDWHLKRRRHSYFPRYTRSQSEPPCYSKVPAVSPLGAINPRLSRSVFSIRNKYPGRRPNPPFYDVPHTAELSKTIKNERDEMKEIMCTKLNGAFVSCFSIAGTELGVLMVKKPADCLSKIKFRRFNMEFNNFVFPCFTFSMVERTPLEYLIRLRYSSTTPFKFVFPATEMGALMPPRAVYDYLRVARRVPRPIKWTKKSTVKKIDVRSNMKAKPNPVQLTVVDVFKYLGLYCPIPRQSRAFYAVLSVYGKFLKTGKRAVNRFYKETLWSVSALILDVKKSFYQEDSEEWAEKCARISAIVSKKVKPNRLEDSILTTILAVVQTSNEKKGKEIPLVKVVSGLSLEVVHKINKDLADYYYRFQNTKYALYGDEMETEEESASDLEFDIEVDVTSIQNPIFVKTTDYYLGHFQKVVMKDPCGNDISKVLPNSRWLKGKTGESKKEKLRIQTSLYEKRIKKKWDDSCSEDEGSCRSRNSKKRRYLSSETPSDENSEFSTQATTPRTADSQSIADIFENTEISDDVLPSRKKVIFVEDNMVRYFDRNDYVETFVPLEIDQDDSSDSQDEDEDDWATRKKEHDAQALATLEKITKEELLEEEAAVKQGPFRGPTITNGVGLKKEEKQSQGRPHQQELQPRKLTATFVAPIGRAERKNGSILKNGDLRNKVIQNKSVPRVPASLWERI